MPFPDQDRSRWDRTLIRLGLADLDRAIELRRPPGSYTVQAAIAGCHSRVASFAETDWEAVVSLYDAPSPVVEMNRAVATLHADGRRPRWSRSMRCARTPDWRAITCAFDASPAT
ncbi:MAG TPA: hypothetical protein VIT65_24895 [Microlunatus sp.]